MAQRRQAEAANVAAADAASASGSVCSSPGQVLSAAPILRRRVRLKHNKLWIVARRMGLGARPSLAQATELAADEKQFKSKLLESKPRQAAMAKSPAAPALSRAVPVTQSESEDEEESRTSIFRSAPQKPLRVSFVRVTLVLVLIPDARLATHHDQGQGEQQRHEALCSDEQDHKKGRDTASMTARLVSDNWALSRSAPHLRPARVVGWGIAFAKTRSR